MNQKQLIKYSLKKQAEYRKQKKDSSWLASYARGFNHPNFKTK